MSTEIINTLNDLLQLDIDAVNAYEQALKQIDNSDIHSNIESFRQDHLRHIMDLKEIIRKHSGSPVQSTPDLKGYLLEGFTALRSVTGTKGALSAMEANEKITSKNYGDALQEDILFPADVKELLLKNFADETRHLEYITNALKNWKPIYDVVKPK